MKSATLVLAMALAAGTALAQPANQPMRHGDQTPMNGRMALMQKLNLTEDQQSQIRKLHVDFQKKQIQNQAKIRLARLDLAQMLQADKPDRSAIEKAVRDVSALETDNKVARIDQMLAIRNVLTPDQLKIWKEQRMNRRGMMRGEMMRERMMMRRGHPGVFGDSMDPLPGDESLAPLSSDEMMGMAALPDPMDMPEPMMDDVELGDIDVE